MDDVPGFQHFCEFSKQFFKLCSNFSSMHLENQGSVFYKKKCCFCAHGFLCPLFFFCADCFLCPLLFVPIVFCAHCLLCPLFYVPIVLCVPLCLVCISKSQKSVCPIILVFVLASFLGLSFCFNGIISCGAILYCTSFLVTVSH